jgi:uncharacterized protein
MPTNAEIVQALLDAFGRGDIPGILNLCTEDVEVLFRGDPTTIPFAGNWKGKAKVAEYFRTIGETLDLLKFEPRRSVASGDRVAAFGAMDVRGKATGKTAIGSDWAADFRVQNGKITGWQVYIDTAAWEEALSGTRKTAA